MSEDTRSTKRRRISSKYDQSTPTKPSDAARSARSTGGKSARRPIAISSSNQSRPNSAKPPDKVTSVGSGRKSALKPTADQDDDPESEGSQQDSDEEPRRSSRKRKPSAKLVSAQKDEIAVQKAGNVPSHATNGVLSKNTPPPSVSQPRALRDKVSKEPKKRGRPRKPETEKTQAEEPAQAPTFVETPRKRGRPKKVPDLESPAHSSAQKQRVKIASPAPRNKQSVEDTAGEVDGDALSELNEELIKSSSKSAQIASSILRNLNDGEYPFSKLRDIVLQKLTQRRPVPLIHLDSVYANVYGLLEATVTAGESNSMVLVGARSSGKTTLVDKALSELSIGQKEHFHVVRLNGFIQTDDKLALREIWRQLGKEMDIDEEVSKSYADTLTMLLALLSHPDEIARESIDGVAKSVIFIMDEFDLFATHSRQTLLYNLLDIAQSRKAPIAVLGLTTKFDVSERLEKRVKSRFSHRYAYLSLPKSIVAFQDICKAALSIQAFELSVDEQLAIPKQSSDHVSGRKAYKLGLPNCLEAWNASVNALFGNQSFISSYLRPVYHLTKSIPTVLSSLIIPISNLAPPRGGSDTLLPVRHFLGYSPTPPLVAPTSSLALLLPSMSELQLSLLIGAARLDVIHDSDTCSFGMAYAEYVELAGKARLQSSAAGALASGAGARVWGRDVAKGEWEALIRYGLLVPVSEASSASAVATVGGLVSVDVKLEEIPGAVPGLSSMMERWCKQI